MAQKNTILKSLGLATLLALGFGIVIGLGVGWCIAIVERIQSRGEARVSENLIFRPDGTPLIHRYTYGEYHGRDSYWTLDGREIKVKRDERFICRPAYLFGPQSLAETSFPLRTRDRVAGFTDGRDPVGYWYFLHDGRREGSGYFVGFNSKTKRCLGYLGKKGLQPTVPTRKEQFPVDGRQMHSSNYSSRAAFCLSCPYKPRYYWSSDYLYEKDFPPWRIIMIWV